MTDLMTDPATIDWPARQATARIPYTVTDGLPINPAYPDLPAGQGELAHWGEKACADTGVFATIDGVRWLLLGLRGDGHGWALPGGRLEGDESDLAGALRELGEETGITIDVTDPDLTVSVEGARYVPDPRAARNAWMVTTLVVVDFGVRQHFPHARAGSDLVRVAWFPARSLPALETAIRHRDPAGKLFFSHRAIIAELLGAGAA
jgi:8-oxo-dGTP pyrophosphatase MutT (NUDIX family)